MKRLLLAAFLIIPSIGIVFKFGHLLGLILYTTVTITIASLKPERFTPQKHILLFAVLTLLAVLIVFLIIYPKANSGFYGGGTDSDDGLDIAVRALIKGEYPYYLKSYLGNRLSPMPGAILLSIPFVLIYGSALQNIFWLAVLFLLIRRFVNERAALLTLWLLILFSPVVMWSVVIGSDYLSNTIYVLVFSFLLIKGKLKWLWAVLLGVGLSSRANFIMLVPVTFAALVYSEGLKWALVYSLIACLTFALVTLPFYFYDPAGFSPLYVQTSKAQRLAPAIAGVISFYLAWKYVKDIRTALLACAVVQFVVVLGSALLAGSVLSYATYGTFFSLFGIFGLLIQPFNSTRTRRKQTESGCLLPDRWRHTSE